MIGKAQSMTNTAFDVALAERIDLARYGSNARVCFKTVATS